MDVLLFLMFILTVFGVSLSGVLMPGPVMAAAVVKGVKEKNAGAWIGFGHLIVEVPMILLLAAGFYYLFRHPWVEIGIGVLGGILLLYMGIRMVQMRKAVDVIEKAFPTHSFFAGMITTITNPYYMIWWATAGAWLIILALGFGWMGIVALLIIHESCDIGWDYFVSYSVNTSKKFWTNKAYNIVFGGCGIFLICFGVFAMVGVWF